MGEIYRRADRVVIWLGPEADDSTLSIGLMSTLASKVEMNWDTYVIKPSLRGADEPHWVSGFLSFLIARRNGVLYRVSSPDVGSKSLWVRQEIAFSTNNAVKPVSFCGKATIVWRDFRKANYRSDDEGIFEHF